VSVTAAFERLSNLGFPDQFQKQSGWILRNKRMDTAGDMGSTGLMDALPARSFTQYVATAIALNTRHLNRLRRAVRRTALAHRSAGRDHAAEERWDGEGGNSQSAGRREPHE
jgi:hypothetical protein